MPGMPEHRPRTALGFDVGRARVGVAVGQELTASARALTTLRAGDWPGVERLLREWRPQLLVVGVPRHADGNASHSTEAALAFAHALGERSGLPVTTVDERLSSHAAEQRLRERGVDSRRARKQIDAEAAAVILETWFGQMETVTDD